MLRDLGEKGDNYVIVISSGRFVELSLWFS